MPHEFITRYHAVRLYRSGVCVAFVCKRYHISKSSLLRWNKRYDGTEDSLRDKPHKPHSAHPNAHTPTEIAWIRNYFRRNPGISVCEPYGKLKTVKGFSRKPSSLYRVCRCLSYFQHTPATKKPYKPKPYDTPTQLGVKWQVDVKYIPSACYSGQMPQKFYQYTVIGEASHERFIYPYMEQGSSVSFLKKAIAYFGYAPQIIQTDSGAEFTHLARTVLEHPLDILCRELGICHQLIRPRTPRHNGKVEHSRRNDQERFYNHMSFYSYQDLVMQMGRYLRRSNSIPM